MSGAGEAGYTLAKTKTFPAIPIWIQKTMLDFHNRDFRVQSIFSEQTTHEKKILQKKLLTNCNSFSPANNKHFIFIFKLRTELTGTIPAGSMELVHAIGGARVQLFQV